MWLFPVLALLLAAFVLAVALAYRLPPPAAIADPMDDFARIVAQNALIGELRNCLDRPLQPAQLEFLQHASFAEAQAYPRLFIDDPHCAARAIRACETVYPGKCL